MPTLIPKFVLLFFRVSSSLLALSNLLLGGATDSNNKMVSSSPRRRKGQLDEEVQQQQPAQDRRHDYDNYQDSEIILFLQQCLTHNTRIALVCSASPFVLEETQAILEFATRAQLASTQAKRNQILISHELFVRRFLPLPPKKTLCSSRGGGGEEVLTTEPGDDAQEANGMKEEEREPENSGHIDQLEQTHESMSVEDRDAGGTEREPSPPVTSEGLEEKFRHLQLQLFENTTTTRGINLPRQFGGVDQQQRSQHQYSEGGGHGRPLTAAVENMESSKEQVVSHQLTPIDRTHTTKEENTKQTQSSEASLLRLALSKKEIRIQDLEETLKERDSEVAQLKAPCALAHKKTGENDEEKAEESLAASDQAQITSKNTGVIESEAGNHRLRGKLEDNRRERLALAQQWQAVIAESGNLGKQNDQIKKQYEAVLKENTSLVQDKKSLSEQVEELKSQLQKATIIADQHEPRDKKQQLTLQDKLDCQVKEYESMKEELRNTEAEAGILRLENDTLLNRVNSVQLQLAPPVPMDDTESTNSKQSLDSIKMGLLAVEEGDGDVVDEETYRPLASSTDTTPATDSSAMASKSTMPEGECQNQNSHQGLGPSHGSSAVECDEKKSDKHQDDGQSSESQLKEEANKSKANDPATPEALWSKNSSENTARDSSVSFPQEPAFTPETFKGDNNNEQEEPTTPVSTNSRNTKSELDELGKQGVAKMAMTTKMESSHSSMHLATSSINVRERVQALFASKASRLEEQAATNQLPNGPKREKTRLSHSLQESTSRGTNGMELSEDCATVESSSRIEEYARTFRGERDAMIKMLQQGVTAVQTSNAETCTVESLLQKITEELGTFQETFNDVREDKDKKHQREEPDLNEPALLFEAINTLKVICEKLQTTASELTKEQSSSSGLRSSLKDSENERMELMEERARLEKEVVEFEKKLEALQAEKDAMIEAQKSKAADPPVAVAQLKEALRTERYDELQTTPSELTNEQPSSSSLRSSLEDSENARMKLLEERATLEEKVAQLEEKVETLLAEKDAMTKEVQKLQDAGSRVEVGQLGEVSRTERDELRTTPSELTNEKSPSSTLRCFLEDSENVRIELLEERASLETKVADLEEKVKTLRTEKDAMGKEIQKLKDPGSLVEMTQLKENIEALQAERDEMTKVLEDLTCAAAEVQDDMEVLVNEKYNLKRELDARRSELATVKAKMETRQKEWQQEKQAFEAERESLVEHLDTVSQQISKVNEERRKERESLVSSVKSLEAGLGNATEEKKQLYEESSIMRTSVAEQQSEMKRLVNKLAETNEKLETKDAENNEMEVLLREAAANIRMLVSDLEVALEKNILLGRERDLIGRELASTKDQLSNAASDADALRRKSKLASTKLEGLLVSCSNLRSALNDSEGSRASLSRECDSLRKIVERSQSELATSSTELRAALQTMDNSDISERQRSAEMVEQLMWEKETLEKECESLKEEVKLLQRQIYVSSNDLPSASKELLKTRTERADLVEPCETLTNEYNTLAKEKNQQADELYNVNAEVQQLTAQMESMQVEILDGKKSKSNDRSQLEELLQSTRNDLVAENEQLYKQLLQQQSDIARRPALVSITEDEVDSLSNGNRATTKEIELLKQRSIVGSGTVSTESSLPIGPDELEWVRLAKSFDKEADDNNEDLRGVPSSTHGYFESLSFSEVDGSKPLRFLGSTPLIINSKGAVTTGESSRRQQAVEEITSPNCLNRLEFVEELERNSPPSPGNQTRWGGNASTRSRAFANSKQQATWCNPHVGMTGVYRERKSDLSWQDGIASLGQYMKGYPHVVIPEWFRDSQNRDLGKWVEDCRQDWKQGILTPDQVSTLDKLCSFWKLNADCQEFPQRTYAWETWLRALDSYQRAYDETADVPPGYRDPYGRRLGSWVQKQRDKRQNGSLTSKQIQELNERGFAWTDTI